MISNDEANAAMNDARQWALDSRARRSARWWWFTRRRADAAIELAAARGRSFVDLTFFRLEETARRARLELAGRGFECGTIHANEIEGPLGTSGRFGFTVSWMHKRPRATV